MTAPTTKDSLPCGCRPGVFLCPTAERLWATTNTTYRRGTETADPADYRAYREAFDAYTEHLTCPDCEHAAHVTPCTQTVGRTAHYSSGVAMDAEGPCGCGVSDAECAAKHAVPVKATLLHERPGGDWIPVCLNCAWRLA